MRRQDFYYDLPDSLIARTPTAERRGSRLLCLDGPTGALDHKQFPELLDLVNAGDLMIFNDTRVIPARLFGRKERAPIEQGPENAGQQADDGQQREFGGHVEILIERILDTHRVLTHTRASKAPRPNSFVILEDGTRLKMIARHDALFEWEFQSEETALSVLDRIGHMPLPPYIDRQDIESDRERYQTVYNQKQGAVAAPTAGLHFDEQMLNDLRAKGVQIGFVTLHVGAGTFQPVRADDITQHHMHSEVMDLSAEVCELVKMTKAARKRVIAVGTTSVRCLESAAQGFNDPKHKGEVHPYQGETEIFIFPSYEFKVVDALITNFHLPESTLLMLVSALAGYAHTMHAYKEAVANNYRFFSYGDAMFVTKNPEAITEIP